MSRWTFLLVVLLIAGGGGAWYWAKSQTAQIEQQDSETVSTILPNTPGRGTWYSTYHSEVAELEATRDAIGRMPDATPKIIADVEKTVAFGMESRWRGAVKKQMQECLLAFRGYHSAFRRLGPDPSTTPKYFDENGRLLVSWRVHLLGFLGERTLLDEFHLDEPWDSPHNQKLVARMPDVFRAVDEPDDCMTTRFAIVDGPGSLFEEGHFRSLEDVHDPVSETIFLVMLPRERAVPWTKPDDVVIDPTDPLASFAPLGENGFYFMTVEGALLRWRQLGTPAQFLALLSCQGGEPEGTLQEMFNTDRPAGSEADGARP